MSETATEQIVHHPDNAVIGVSAEALAMVIEVRANEDHADTLGLRISITGTAGVDYAYDLAFVGPDEFADDDRKWEIEGLTMLVPEESVDRLTGATL
ncbi:MAG: hypothetical protein HOF47_01105, partial [Actinobacteria bacterium]|nr:hypothetical protein [Actinomycetota bacterium]